MILRFALLCMVFSRKPEDELMKLFAYAREAALAQVDERMHDEIEKTLRSQEN